MKYPGGKNQHFRHLLFLRFHRGQKAGEAARDICNVYGKGVIGERAAQKWFAKFKNGDLDLEDTPRSGRPSEFDEEHLKALNTSAVTTSNHLQSIGFSQKLGAWGPHELNETKENCLQIAAQHLARHQHRAINNVFHAEDTPEPRIKQDLHPQKVMICLFWDCKGVLYWEMLEMNATVNKDLYIAQFHHMNEAIQQKRPDRQGQIILLHDNVRSHVAQVVKAALQELKLEVLQHPPYSPDLATTDYHLFRSMSNYMRGTTFDAQNLAQQLL
ncbi:hypothetical protein LAZ67_23001248 [Cordylochernes scorpioides]|uniref:Mos1 transposase HTH domain-containing protein n=1 Tax=Cordylochernes scorpioides TaxID=51811 RepID=A0ABY6LQJ0_9ARAC|nr:hypothetical protein LAZ67_23001248 [Cordylochernes scorpioides]